MKSNLIIAALLLFVNSLLYSQWTSEESLNFTIQSNTKVSSYADQNGIHIVYSRNGGIKYALINSDGDMIKYDKVIESEGSGTDYANVVTIDSDIFAIYYKNNDIKVAKSSNNGDSWNNTYSYYDLKNTGCNKIIANRLPGQTFANIVWSERRIGSQNYYDVHYVRFIPSSQTWTAYENVSSSDNYGGEKPDFALSSSRVHVNYNNIGGLKDRDRLITWNNIQSVPFQLLAPSVTLHENEPVVTGSTLNTFYKAMGTSLMYPASYYIGHSYKDVSTTTWYENETTLTTDSYGSNFDIYTFAVNSTADGKIHILYYEKNYGWAYRTLTGTTYSDILSQITISRQEGGYNSLVNNSNDLFLLYADNYSTPGAIKFRHYDTAPLAPQNLSINQSQGNHPYLSWTANTETDRYYYRIYRIDSYGGAPVVFQTSNNYYEDVTLDYCTAVPPATCPNERNFTYYVTAVDKGLHESPQSNSVITKLVGGAVEKISVNNPTNTIWEYGLDQNYPNPFNPVTSINYQIKEKGFVTLKVYDMVGKEVASLVNETQTEGQYTVAFDASNLPSGVYVYSLRVNDFVKNNKMTLLK